MNSTIKFIFRLIGEAHTVWAHDRAVRVGTALAYHTLFSLAQLLVIMINVAEAAIGRPILPASNAVSMKLARYSDVRNKGLGIR